MIGRDEFVTVPEASTELGYSVQHTRLLVRQGRLTGEKVGRDWLVLRRSVLELKAMRNTAPLIPSMRKGRPPRGPVNT